METTQRLTNAAWRKSSYSADQGECVECAPLGDVAWRTSSYSADQGDCVEIAAQPCRIAVRDSKVPEGPAFTVAPTAFAAFTASLKS